LAALTPSLSRSRERVIERVISRKGAKGAKAGEGTKVDFFTGGNEDNRDELNTPFPLLSPVRRSSFACLASWRDDKIPVSLSIGTECDRYM